MYRSPHKKPATNPKPQALSRTEGSRVQGCNRGFRISLEPFGLLWLMLKPSRQIQKPVGGRHHQPIQAEDAAEAHDLEGAVFIPRVTVGVWASRSGGVGERGRPRSEVNDMTQ